MIKKKGFLALALSVAEMLCLSFIFSNSLKSKSVSAEQSKPFEDMIKPSLDAMGTSGNTAEIAAIIVRKSAHVAEFFTLTLICLAILHLLGKKTKLTVTFGVAFGFICAATDETLQIFSHRGAAVKDVFIDGIGVALAVAAYLIFVKFKKCKAEG